MEIPGGYVEVPLVMGFDTQRRIGKMRIWPSGNIQGFVYSTADTNALMVTEHLTFHVAGDNPVKPDSEPYPKAEGAWGEGHERAWNVAADLVSPLIEEWRLALIRDTANWLLGEDIL